MRFVRVSGHSMQPRYRDGDYVLVCRYRFRKPSPGDDIVFRHRDLGTLLKTVSHIKDGKLHLRGLSRLSTPAAALGVIDETAWDSLERAVLRIPRPSGRSAESA